MCPYCKKIEKYHLKNHLMKKHADKDDVRPIIENSKSVADLTERIKATEDVKTKEELKTRKKEAEKIGRSLMVQAKSLGVSVQNMMSKNTNHSFTSARKPKTDNNTLDDYRTCPECGQLLLRQSYHKHAKNCAGGLKVIQGKVIEFKVSVDEKLAKPKYVKQFVDEVLFPTDRRGLMR